MIYNVIFNVNEEILLDEANNADELKLTPVELFKKQLKTLALKGIDCVEVVDLHN